jgi:hypothetical protein
MKHFKSLSLLPIAVAAMLSFAASASATYVTTTTGGAAATPTIHAVNEGGHVSIANPNANIECSSTFSGEVVSHGVGGEVWIPLTNISFTSCTNGWTVGVIWTGELRFNASSGHNGSLMSTGTTLRATLHTIFGVIECNYNTFISNFGTVTGGNPATLNVSGPFEFHSGSGLCGSGSAKISGNYVTTSALYIHK